MQRDSAQEQYDKMTKTPVHQLVLRLGLPTTVSMLVTSIYNMADTFCQPARNQRQRRDRRGICADGHHQRLRIHVRTWRRKQYQPEAWRS